jgi:uncharacterized LabA/DUF88 family protein
MGTAKSLSEPWKINLAKFRVYLLKKYSVEHAYYFLGFVQEEHTDLYEEIQKAGFVLIFREHNPAMIGKKKGNIDSDIIFHVMKKLYLNDNFSKVLLVSGDGDYKLLVDFLIAEKRFEKILFPNRKFASSLYKKIGSQFYDYLENIKEKIK